MGKSMDVTSLCWSTSKSRKGWDKGRGHKPDFYALKRVARAQPRQRGRFRAPPAARALLRGTPNS